MRKLGFVLVAVLAAAMAFANGGRQPAAPSASGGRPATLEFWTWLDEEPYMSKLINQWNQTHPDIQVHGVYTDSVDDNYTQKVTVALSGGSNIDILCQSNPAGLADYIDLNQILPLDDLMKKYNYDESGVSGFVNSFRAEKKVVYGLPYRKSVWALFYNKKIFDDAGIPYPKNYTWEQYTQVGKQLTKGTGENKIYGILNYQPTSGWWRVPANVSGANNPVVPRELLLFKKAAEMTWNWSYTDGSQPPYSERTGTSGGDYAGTFLQGNFGMMITGDWVINMLNNGVAAGATLQYDVAECPYYAGETQTSTGVPTVVGIPKNSKNPEAAFQFIQYLCGPEAAKFLAGEGLIPAWGSSDIQVIFEKQLSQPKNVGVLFTQKVNSQAPFDSKYNIGMRIVNQEMSLYLLKEQDLEKTYSVIAQRIKDEID